MQFAVIGETSIVNEIYEEIKEEQTTIIYISVFLITVVVLVFFLIRRIIKRKI